MIFMPHPKKCRKSDPEKQNKPKKLKKRKNISPIHTSEQKSGTKVSDGQSSGQLNKVKLNVFTGRNLIISTSGHMQVS